MAHDYKAGSKRRNQDSNLGRFQNNAHSHYIVLSRANSVTTMEEDEVTHPRSQRSGFGESETEMVTSQYVVTSAAVTVSTVIESQTWKVGRGH